MPAKLSIHIPDQAVVIRVLQSADDIILGRDPAAAIVLAHASVSRQHAQLRELAPGRWQLQDRGSKNGTRLDGKRIAMATLENGNWFAVGDVYCEFQIIDEAQQQQLQARASERRHASAAWASRLRVDADLTTLLGGLLEGIVQVAECQRGFLLTPDGDGHLRVAACFGLDPAELQSLAFYGSRSAVERALAERRPIFLSNQQDGAWLQESASIVAQGIRALVCLPMLNGAELLGIAYADTADLARVFTDLDAEVLAALVDHAASVLAAGRIAAQLAQLSAWVAVDASGVTRVAGAAPNWPAHRAGRDAASGAR